jgi:undecaprenyl-diphosphatase
VWLAIALVVSLLWRRWGTFILTVLVVAVADFAATVLKAAIDVPRPSTRYADPKPLVPAPHDHSFPSGHAATSFAAATVLTAALPRSGPLWFLLALAVGFSRVYVGVHYPLDIIGGAVLGIAVTTALRRLVAVRRRSRGARQSG